MIAEDHKADMVFLLLVHTFPPRGGGYDTISDSLVEQRPSDFDDISAGSQRGELYTQVYPSAPRNEHGLTLVSS
jgi:hypothetical protein